MTEYVIIGNGTAAAGCIEGIRSCDSTGGITVISEENYPVYCRPLISYYLEGKTDLDKINYRPADFYEQNHCRVLYGKKAISIDPAAQTVTLNDGTALSYTSLCMATGSTPFIPPMQGLETVENRFSFLTLDDTLALEKAIRPDTRVLIVGAGLIGLKCAEGLRDRVAEITVCDLADRVLSSILDPESAALVQQHLEANGIQFLLSDTAAEFQGNTARMKSGKTVAFDLLVLAVGVKANTTLIQAIGSDVGKGIQINSRMETSLPDIYAAGDCTESVDISSGEQKIMALMPNAFLQGRCAGINMAGGSKTFDNAIPMNAIGFFGLHIMTAGSYTGEVYEEKSDGTLKKLFIRDGLLVGFILIGCTDRAGIYTSLIRERTPLDSLDFEMLKKQATSAAFSAETRGIKFGGVV